MKYELYASESAFKRYPMKVIDGHFLTREGARNLYVPTAASVNKGWGTGRSNHVLSDQMFELPRKLTLTWLSFMEDRFYTGTWDLPVEELEARLSTPFTDPRVDEMNRFNTLIAGMAPGGVVVVWAQGIGQQVVIGRYQGQPTEVDWSTMYDNPNMSRAEYVSMVLDDEMTREEQDEAREEMPGPAEMAERNRRYDWLPVLEGTPIIRYFADYIDGEIETLRPQGEFPDRQGRALPKEITVIWPVAGRHRIARVRFDPQERAEAFGRFSEAGEPFRMTFVPGVAGPGLEMRLENGEMVYQFELNDIKFTRTRN